MHNNYDPIKKAEGLYEVVENGSNQVKGKIEVAADGKAVYTPKDPQGIPVEYNSLDDALDDVKKWRSPDDPTPPNTAGKILKEGMDDGNAGAAGKARKVAPKGLPPGFDPAKGFASFEDFKKAFGAAGEGQAWHHIVEQTINTGKFAAEILHNPANLLRLPHGKGSIHAKISGYYSSKIPGLTGNKTVREWLSTKSFQEQFDFGVDVIKQYGGTQYLPPHLR